MFCPALHPALFVYSSNPPVLLESSENVAATISPDSRLCFSARSKTIALLSASFHGWYFLWKEWFIVVLMTSLLEAVQSTEQCLAETHFFFSFYLFLFYSVLWVYSHLEKFPKTVTEPACHGRRQQRKNMNRGVVFRSWIVTLIIQYLRPCVTSQS